MSAEKKLSELAERKQLLLLQADLHRAVLQAEIATLRARWQWVAQARDKFPAKAGWLLGSAAGVLAVRNWRHTLKLIPVGLATWRWWRKLRNR
jgi:hypothetical protein